MGFRCAGGPVQAGSLMPPPPPPTPMGSPAGGGGTFETRLSHLRRRLHRARPPEVARRWRISVQPPRGDRVRPLLERRHEVVVLTDAVEAAAAGNGSMALLEGPSGIGKSRLLQTVGDLGAERGALVLTTCGGELEREYPFGLVRRLLENR